MAFSFASDQIREHEAPLVRDLFNRIVQAEEPLLTEEQRANPRAYFIAAWHEAAEAITRPLQSRLALEEELRKYQPEKNPFELDD